MIKEHDILDWTQRRKNQHLNIGMKIRLLEIY